MKHKYPASILNFKLKSICLVLTLALTGCAQAAGRLLNSLDHRYEYETVNGENGPLYKAVSFTGLLPIQKLGVPYSFDVQEGADTSIEVGGEKTLYTSQVAGEHVTMADVRNVSQKILEIKRMGNKVIHTKLDLIKAQKDKNAPLASQYGQDYEFAKKNLDDAHRAAVAALKPGIIILQWDNASNGQDGFTFAKSGYQYSYNDQFKGLLVLGGIKISKLSSLGKDFCPRLAALKPSKDSCCFNQSMVIPTYMIQARHLFFLDVVNDSNKDTLSVDLDKAVEANLLSILDKIEIESLHKQAYSLFGAGEISGLKTTVEPGYGDKNNPWVTVYAIMPSVQNLSSKLKKWCS